MIRVEIPVEEYRIVRLKTRLFKPLKSFVDSGPVPGLRLEDRIAFIKTGRWILTVYPQPSGPVFAELKRYVDRSTIARFKLSDGEVRVEVGGGEYGPNDKVAFAPEHGDAEAIVTVQQLLQRLFSYVKIEAGRRIRYK